MNAAMSPLEAVPPCFGLYAVEDVPRPRDRVMFVPEMSIAWLMIFSRGRGGVRRTLPIIGAGRVGGRRTKTRRQFASGFHSGWSSVVAIGVQRLNDGRCACSWPPVLLHRVDAVEDLRQRTGGAGGPPPRAAYSSLSTKSTCSCTQSASADKSAALYRPAWIGRQGGVNHLSNLAHPRP